MIIIMIYNNDLPRLWRMGLRSQTLCHSVSRVLTHSLRASWVASIHTGAVLATQLQPASSSMPTLPQEDLPFIWVVTEQPGGGAS